MMTENIPIPIEMDAESVNGKRLMAAVCQFSATVAAHLETYVHAIISLQCEYFYQLQYSSSIHLFLI